MDELILQRTTENTINITQIYVINKLNVYRASYIRNGIASITIGACIREHILSRYLC